MGFKDFINQEKKKVDKPKYPKKYVPKLYSTEEKEYMYKKIFAKSSYVDLRGIRKKFK